MAATIEISLSTYLIDFVGGQSAFRSPPYTQYATDLDTNFVTLRNTINTLIAEVKAVQGPNAAAGLQAFYFNDPNRGASSDGLTGRLGYHSYLCEIHTTPSQLRVDPGFALYDGDTISSATTIYLTGSGGAKTYYVRLMSTGSVQLETTSGTKDLYEAVWNGTIFTAVTRSAETELFFDGDDYEAMRKRVASGATPATFPALEFDQFNHRMVAVERILAGLTTDGEGNALGQPAIRTGTAAAPGLVVVGSTNTGIYGTTTTLSISTAGVNRVTISASGLVLAVPLTLGLGSAAAPSFTFTGDTNTGMYSPGADQLGLATNGTLALSVTAQQQVDSPTQFRVRGSRTATQSITSGSTTNVSFTAADEYDIGTWHNEGGGAPGDQEFTVPTGGSRLYIISAKGTWAANTTGYRQMDITVGGTAVATIKHPTAQTGTTPQSVSVVLELSAAQVVRLAVTQNSGGALNISECRLSITALW